MQRVSGRRGGWGDGLEAAELVAFDEFKFAAEVVEGLEVVADVDEHDGQEGEDDDQG